MEQLNVPARTAEVMVQIEQLREREWDLLEQLVSVRQHRSDLMNLIQDRQQLPDYRRDIVS
jgi:hypothetical protein